MEKDARIYIAGMHTLIGAALLARLTEQGYSGVVGEEGEAVDLTKAVEVDAFFGLVKPTHVFLVGGKSGGIRANQRYPADLMQDNLLVACHVVQSAYRHGVKKLFYLASSCSYPRQCSQPMRVNSLLTGPLEPTSEAYAMAKLAGITLCRAYRQQYGTNFISGIPADVFGPGDDFDREDSHVVAALIRKIHDAKTLGVESVEIWGTGSPRRELIFVEDLVDACIFVMHGYSDSQPINLGCGSDISISRLAELIKEIVGFQGRLQFDPSKPDGMPSKILDSTILRAMGWHPRIPLRSSLLQTYEWFLALEQRRRATRAS